MLPCAFGWEFKTFEFDYKYSVNSIWNFMRQMTFYSFENTMNLL